MKKNLNIDDYKDELGEDFELVKELWEIFSSQDISILCEESLQKDEIPVGECTDLQKILLACLCVADTPTRQMLMQRAFLINAYKEFKLSHGTILRIKKFFIIAVKKS